jgi:hypothetical protein
MSRSLTGIVLVVVGAIAAFASPISAGLETRTIQEEVQSILAKRSPNTWVLWGHVNNTSPGEVVAFYYEAEEVGRDTTLYDPQNPSNPFYGVILSDLQTGNEIRAGTTTGRPCPLRAVDGQPLIYRAGEIDNRDLEKMTEVGIPEFEEPTETTWGAIKALYK